MCMHKNENESRVRKDEVVADLRHIFSTWPPLVFVFVSSSCPPNHSNIPTSHRPHPQVHPRTLPCSRPAIHPPIYQCTFPSPPLVLAHPPARLSQLIKRGEYNALTGAAKLRFFYNKGQGTLAKGANFRDPRS